MIDWTPIELRQKGRNLGDIPIVTPVAKNSKTTDVIGLEWKPEAPITYLFGHLR